MSTNLRENGAAAVIAAAPEPHSTVASPVIQQLTGGYEEEVLGFLSERPLHTVSMMEMILENGLVSPLNRGDFYAARDDAGRINGVAIIGHATLIEARTDKALKAFAHLAQQNTRTHLIRIEKEKTERFLNYFKTAEPAPRHVCREILFVQREFINESEPVSELRPATLDDLDLVLEVNAQMIEGECGVNPLQTDPAGFRKRTARRVEHGRIWVWIKDGRLIFKTDIISATPQAAYLEGVYVNSQERGKGYGLRCFTQLSNHLLKSTKSLCLLVNENNQAAINFYHKAGYTPEGCYDTVYLHGKNS